MGKKKKLENDGWKISDVNIFLQLTSDEQAAVESQTMIQNDGLYYFLTNPRFVSKQKNDSKSIYGTSIDNE